MAATIPDLIKGNMKLPILSSSPIRAKTCETLEESVTAFNQELGLHPDNTVARQILYETMQQLLRKDALLAYQGETVAKCC
jgi:hypothetical protein